MPPPWLKPALADGEPVRRVRNKAGRVTEIWLASGKFLPEGRMAREMAARYGDPGAEE